MPGNIGLPEIAIVLVIALIVFGPKRLPELGRSIGDGLREFKSSVSGEKRDDEDDEDDEDLPQTIDDGVAEEEPVDAEPVDAEPADEGEPAGRPSS
jgi:sec-independent protein translocase protein TatA